MTQSFYVEPPTIPEGMTVAEYRRARVRGETALLPKLLCWLERLAGGDGASEGWVA